jgi:hypothetical protein
MALADMFHETLHNLGRTDKEIQQAWDLPVDPNNTKNISDDLVKNDCVH